MAEETYTETQSSTTEAPSDSGNGSLDSSATGSDYSSTDTSTATEHDQGRQDFWRDLGYESPEELSNTHTRYKQQIAGSQRETQRMRDEMQQYQQRLAYYEGLLQQGQQGTAPGSSAQPQELSLEHAIEAYLNNDVQTLARFKQQEQVRADRLAQQKVLDTLHTVVKPAQYSDALMRQYPELNDPHSTLYRQVYARYEAEAADPIYRLMFPSDEMEAYRDAYSPDGAETKRVDMRIVNVLAHKVAADLARQAGRVDEARRRGAAGGAGPEAGRGRDDRAEPSAIQLVTPRERAEIANLLQQNALPSEWGRTVEQVAAYRVKQWKEKDKQKFSRRVEQFRNGTLRDD